MNFAFYGRVSTEDQQDPASSRAWQLARSTTLIEPAKGEVVAEYFDIGQSRSLPWKRRPEAARLLKDLARKDRGYEAVVIGEPARAFYGNQFGLTFPVFVHYSVGLWVPEVGGAVDPGSEAHDLVMALYGGMSKGERNRIRIRVRTAMASQAKVEGRFLGGRPPYGYALADAGPHPNPGKAANGQRRQRLHPDPSTAPVVQRIFREYVGGKGLNAIAEGLTRDGILSPSGNDPRRNPHRASSRGAWAHTAVRSILKNPRYTGHEVWNKQRRDEVLLNVEDVALGHETKQRWNEQSDWIFSERLVHEAIVDEDTFQAAQERRETGRRNQPRSGKKTGRGYALSGLVYCGVCGRRMSGHWNHGVAYYRCRFRAEYAKTKELDHPSTIYLREEEILPELDGWLAELFSPSNLDTTCALLSRANEDEASVMRIQRIQKDIEESSAKLQQLRTALESGVEASTLVTWINEAAASKAAAERELMEARREALESPDIRTLVDELGVLVGVIENADPRLKREVYSALGLRLEYFPALEEVRIDLLPACAGGGVGGGV